MFFLSDRVSYADSENPSFGLITCKMTDKKPKPQIWNCKTFAIKENFATVSVSQIRLGITKIFHQFFDVLKKD